MVGFDYGAPARPASADMLPVLKPRRELDLALGIKVLVGIVVVCVVASLGIRVVVASPHDPQRAVLPPVGTVSVAPLAELRTPSRVDGQPRYTSPVAREVTYRLYKLFKNPRDAKVLFYGWDRPYYGLAAMLGPNGTARAGWDRATSGERSRGGTVETPRTFAGGMLCGRVAPRGLLPNVTCVWSASTTSGIFIAIGGVSDAAVAKVAAKVRADLEAH